jgi:invasion protein IalB
MKRFFPDLGVGLLRLITLALTFLVMLAVPSWAAPQDGQVFQDWTTRCETDPADASKQRCYIIQGVVVGEQQEPAMLVVVTYAPGQELPLATVILPLGTDLRPGIEVAVDDGEAKRYPFAVCLPDGCQAHMPLDAVQLAALKKGVAGSVTYRGGPDRRVDRIPFSLKGFTAAVDALR